MRRLVTFSLFFLLFQPVAASAAESADFLQPRVTSYKATSLCAEGTCQTLFFVYGKNFLNSNGKPGLKVGAEWAQVIRAIDTQIVAVASQKVRFERPIVAVNKTIHRPTLEITDAVLKRLFDESMDVALSAIRMTRDGSRYIAAGSSYDDPPRVYYRDSYWTSGLLLMIEPSVVRDQILLLARGIGSNGSVPSAMPVNPKNTVMPLWRDHYDSGPYFIMLVSDYIRWTGDTSILKETINGRSIIKAAESILSYLSLQDHDGNLLPEKPPDSYQDWADTIPRGGEVISNVVLYAHAIREMGQLARVIGEKENGRAYDRLFEIIQYQINDRLWNEKTNSYFERCEKNVCDDRLTNESSLAALFDVIDHKNLEVFFDRLQFLETKRNPEIDYGDWGVVNVFPPYSNPRPYTYQNMTDWPFLDAINGGARLKHGNADWEYPLTRWWTYFDARRKAGHRLPEFVSPIDETAGDAQAWSVAPAVSFVRYGLGLDPSMEGTYTPKLSPKGKTTLRNVVFRGKRMTLFF